MKTKKYLVLCTFILVLFQLFIARQTVALAQAPAVEKIESKLCAGKEICIVKVERVIDGDTIELDTGEKVRYIGIDAPETVHPSEPVECFGKEASDKNKELVEGKEIRLEKDISDTDKHGRLLRYVYITENGTEIFVNNHLVRNGFARSSSYPPDIELQEKFQEAEKEARENKKGFWADGICGNPATEENIILNEPEENNKNEEIKSENERLKQEIENLKENYSRSENKPKEWHTGLIWITGFICGALLTALGIWGYGRKFKK